MKKLLLVGLLLASAVTYAQTRRLYIVNQPGGTARVRLDSANGKFIASVPLADFSYYRAYRNTLVFTLRNYNTFSLDAANVKTATGGSYGSTADSVATGLHALAVGLGAAPKFEELPISATVYAAGTCNEITVVVVTGSVTIRTGTDPAVTNVPAGTTVTMRAEQLSKSVTVTPASSSRVFVFTRQ